jgi:hypothetical protein
MLYISSIERLAKEEGRIEGRTEMLIRALEHRLKIAVPEDLASLIRRTTDLALLNRWSDLTLEVASLEEFRRRMQTCYLGRRPRTAHELVSGLGPHVIAVELP